MNALERLANGYEGSIRHLKAEVALREGQLRDFQGRVGKEFEHERYASQLADLRDELRLGLSDGASEEARGKVAELAERIRGLRAANEVEAAPERTVRKAVRAERPVTARIRERMGPQEWSAESRGVSAARVNPPSVTATAEDLEDKNLEPLLTDMAGVVDLVPWRGGSHAMSVARRWLRESRLRLFWTSGRG